MTNLGSWSGVIINSTCSAEEAFAEDPKCTQKDVPGAMLLYHDTTFKVYILHLSNLFRNVPFLTSLGVSLFF